MSRPSAKRRLSASFSLSNSKTRTYHERAAPTNRENFATKPRRGFSLLRPPLAALFRCPLCGQGGECRIGDRCVFLLTRTQTSNLLANKADQQVLKLLRCVTTPSMWKLLCHVLLLGQYDELDPPVKGAALIRYVRRNRSYWSDPQGNHPFWLDVVRFCEQRRAHSIGPLL